MHVESVPTEVSKLLHNLQGTLSITREKAATGLGEITESNENVVIALMIARESDESEDVRTVAAASLRCPINQSILINTPDLASPESPLISGLIQMQRAGRISKHALEKQRDSLRRSAIFLGAGLICLLVFVLLRVFINEIGLFTIYAFYCMLLFFLAGLLLTLFGFLASSISIAKIIHLERGRKASESHLEKISK